MNVGKGYSYLFYKIYKFWEKASTPKFWSDWKASLTIDALEIFLALSGLVYYTIITKKWIHFGDNRLIALIYLLVIALPNYFFFNYNDRWKEMVREFDRWPQKDNERGTIIVWIIVLGIILNLVLAFFLMSQIDWKSSENLSL